MRTAGLLLAGALVATCGRCAVERLSPAADKAAAPVVPAAPSIDAGIDAPPFTAFPERRIPEGTFIEVKEGVWFVAPPGFIATRPDERSLQLSVPGVNIVISVSSGRRLATLKPPREALAAFAKHNDYKVLSLRDYGLGRLLATFTGSDHDGPQEVVLMSHSQPGLRVTVFVLSFGPRIGEPEVSALTDEAFHGRLFLP